MAPPSAFDHRLYWEEVNARRKGVQWLREFYRTISLPDDGSWTAEHRARAEQLRWVLDLFRQHRYRSVLDFGCGPGFWFQLWKDLSLSAAAVEQAESAIPKAEAMADALGLDLPVMRAQGPNLPYPDRAFDVAFTAKVLIHIPPGEIRETISELARVAENLVLLEADIDPAGSDGPHVFGHDYRAIGRDCGLKRVRSHRTHTNERFMLFVPVGPKRRWINRILHGRPRRSLGASNADW